MAVEDLLNDVEKEVEHNEAKTYDMDDQKTPPFNQDILWISKPSFV